jgi:capsular polysaccharide biosynthesis protein
MELLGDFGFVETTLERMSPQEQIETLYDAEAVVGVHGAGLANMLFSPEGLKVAEIFPTYYVIPHYYYLSMSLGHEYAYQCEGGDSRSVGSFKVDLRGLEASLVRLGIDKH